MKIDIKDKRHRKDGLGHEDLETDNAYGQPIPRSRRDTANATRSSSPSQARGGSGQREADQESEDICLSIRGPGAIHMLNGTLRCQDSPYARGGHLGQIKSLPLNTGYFQEVDTIRLFDGVAIYNKSLAPRCCPPPGMRPSA